ncbi:MAG: alpha/beta hydrolase [bacterium]
MKNSRCHLILLAAVLAAFQFHLTQARAWQAAETSQKKASGYGTLTDMPYILQDSADAYRRERCKMDFYYPLETKHFPTIVWFHGGGLSAGNKSIPEELKKQGFAVIAANYRLSPKATAPAYIEDAAEAVAWAFKNIEKYGGSPEKIFVGGHSAGAYLSCMIGLEKKWMARHGIDANQVAGLLPMSSQCITHYTIRKERGIADTQPVIDEYAPLFHVRKDAPPMLLVTGDRELEMLGRYEENAYMSRMMKLAGHSQTKLYELDGYNHGGMIKGAYPLMIRFVKETLAQGRPTPGQNP